MSWWRRLKGESYVEVSASHLGLVNKYGFDFAWHAEIKSRGKKVIPYGYAFAATADDAEKAAWERYRSELKAGNVPGNRYMRDSHKDRQTHYREEAVKQEEKQ